LTASVLPQAGKHREAILRGQKFRGAPILCYPQPAARERPPNSLVRALPGSLRQQLRLAKLRPRDCSMMFLTHAARRSLSPSTPITTSRIAATRAAEGTNAATAPLKLAAEPGSPSWLPRIFAIPMPSGKLCWLRSVAIAPGTSLPPASSRTPEKFPRLWRMTRAVRLPPAHRSFVRGTRDSPDTRGTTSLSAFPQSRQCCTSCRPRLATAGRSSPAIADRRSKLCPV